MRTRRKSPTCAEDLLLRCAPPNANGCCLWQLSVSGDGSPKTTWGHRTTSAIRLMYKFIHGPINKSLDVYHACKEPLCLTPEHLQVTEHVRNAHIPGDLDLKIRDLYLSGKTLKEVADLTGVASATVRKYLKLSGIPRRPAGLLKGTIRVPKEVQIAHRRAFDIFPGLNAGVSSAKMR